jgi:rhomboid protease GluP
LNWEHVVVWIVGIATGMNVAIMLRAKVRLTSPWFVLHAGIFVLTVGGMFWSRTWAAAVGGGSWLLLIFVPSLLLKWVGRLSQQQRYDMASRISALVSWLHPTPAVRSQGEFLAILQAMHQGKIEEALEQLDRLSEEPGPLQGAATYFGFYLREDWDGLLEHASCGDEVEEAVYTPGELAWVLRALAEKYELERMIRVAMEAENQGMLSGNNAFDAWILLMAFTGDVEMTQEIIDGPLHQWTPDMKALMLGTACFAAGESERGSAYLTPLVHEKDVLLAMRSQKRLKQPPPVAHEVLSDDAIAFLATLKQRMMTELRYSGQEQLRIRPLMTWSFSALLCVMFVISEWKGGSTSSVVLLSLGAMVPKLVLNGDYWRLFAFPLLHFGPIHLILNMLALLLFGPFVERALGASRYLFLLIVTAVGGGVLITLGGYLELSPLLMRSAYVGASGAIFGLIGANLMIMIKGWRQERVLMAKRRVWMLVLIIGLQTVFDLSTPNVSIGAHWSGLLLGLICTAFLWHPQTHRGAKTV